MPTYRFKDTNTSEEFDLFMSISKREQYVLDNPTHEAVITSSIPLVYDPGTNLKIDDGFREVLSHIKHRYKINSIKSY
jgi:hypothetical protein